MSHYRVNEFNIEAILTVFLPYHESPHFAKMVTILHIKYVRLLPRFSLDPDYSADKIRHGAFFFHTSLLGRVSQE